MTAVNSLVVSVVSLLIGGFGIYIGSNAVGRGKSYGYAVVSALLGAIVWGITGFLVGGIPGVGPLLTLLAWIWVVKSRYSVGWINASLIGFASWIAAVIALYALSIAGVTSFTAVGIPGT